MILTKTGLRLRDFIIWANFWWGMVMETLPYGLQIYTPLQDFWTKKPSISSDKILLNKGLSGPDNLQQMAALRASQGPYGEVCKAWQHFGR